MRGVHVNGPQQGWVSASEGLSAAMGRRGIALASSGADLECEAASATALRRAASLQLPMDMARAHIDRAFANIKSAFTECESPIERRLLPHLVFADYGIGFASLPAELHCPKKHQAGPQGDLIIIPQFAFIRHRLDFAVIGVVGDQRKIIGVECDGEEFHQDASRDAARDAYLSAFGVNVYRFAGKAIYADAAAAARSVATAMIAWRESVK